MICQLYYCSDSTEMSLAYYLYLVDLISYAKLRHIDMYIIYIYEPVQVAGFGRVWFRQTGNTMATERYLQIWLTGK